MRLHLRGHALVRLIATAVVAGILLSGCSFGGGEIGRAHV